MPLETVCLNRVFGVVQTSQKRRLVTLFGFESASRKEYSVAILGRPRIESGMTITAYLQEADNWQTPIGWRDHESGEVVCEPDAEPVFLCGWSFASFCMTAPGLWYASPIAAMIVVFDVAVFARGVRRYRLLRRVRRKLDASPMTHTQ